MREGAGGRGQGAGGRGQGAGGKRQGAEGRGQGAWRVRAQLQLLVPGEGGGSEVTFCMAPVNQLPSELSIGRLVVGGGCGEDETTCLTVSWLAACWCVVRAGASVATGTGSAVVGGGGVVDAELEDLRLRFEEQELELQRVREKCLPNN